jgi:hypothetical protein
MGQSIVAALCGLHPAVHFISARIDLEREAACDDRVVSQTGAADLYANCLANAADLGRPRQPLSLEPILAPHASQSRGALLTRVRRLLDPRPSREAHLKWASTLASVLAFAAAVLFSPAAQPLVVVLGAVTGVPPMHVAPAISRAGWQSSAFVPSLPAPADTLKSWPSSAIAPAAAHLPVSPRLAPLPQNQLASLDHQFSWTMPGGIATIVTQPIERIGPLIPAPLERRPIPYSSDSPGASLPGREAEPSSDSAWKAAGYTGAAVGLGVARAGVATGAGSRKAGTAVAGFFSRAGKAVAGGF